MARGAVPRPARRPHRHAHRTIRSSTGRRRASIRSSGAAPGAARAYRRAMPRGRGPLAGRVDAPRPGRTVEGYVAEGRCANGDGSSSSSTTAPSARRPPPASTCAAASYPVPVGARPRGRGKRTRHLMTATSAAPTGSGCADGRRRRSLQGAVDAPLANRVTSRSRLRSLSKGDERGADLGSRPAPCPG